MRKYLISAVSLAALTLGGAAYAQDTAAPAPDQPAQAQPGTPDCTANPADPACASGTQAQKVDPNAAAPANTTPPAGTDTNTATGTMAPDTTTGSGDTTGSTTPPDTTANTTTPDTTNNTTVTTTTDTTTKSNSATTADTAGPGFLASSFIGKTVYSAAKENVGDINDLLVDPDGHVKAAVIGVGGFLGMGEKDVAVPLDRLHMTKDENGTDYLTISSTKDELQAATAFDRTMVTGSLK